jgi:hypothetical protein
MECDRPLEDKELRQGDIFAAHPGTENWRDPWRRFGVILTADCDIAQGKSGPNLVYVPIVGLHTYLADVWVPSLASKLHERGLERINKLLSELSGNQTTARHVMNWSDEQIQAVLATPTQQTEAPARQKSLAKILELRDAVKGLDDLRVPKVPSGVLDLPDFLNRIFPYEELVGNCNKPGPEYRRSVLSQTLTALGTKDRMDTWPICDLVGLDPEMREDEHTGFVIDLRRFGTVPASIIMPEKRSWLRDPNLYLRVCRLRGIYKSDLVQKFANLFVRVGLADARQDEQRHISDRLVKRLIPEES